MLGKTKTKVQNYGNKGQQKKRARKTGMKGREHEAQKNVLSTKQRNKVFLKRPTNKSERGGS